MNNFILSVSTAAGIPDLDQGVAGALGPDIEYRVREILQEAIKFMKVRPQEKHSDQPLCYRCAREAHKYFFSLLPLLTASLQHSKRSTLTCADIGHALQLHNVEQLFGYRGGSQQANSYVRAQSGNLFFPADEVVDFNKLLQAPLPPAPRDVSFTVHWLAVEGVQPAIPQNPSLKKKAAAQLRKAKANPLIKPLVSHVLSVELQRYFEEVTKAVHGQDESALQLAIDSVAGDPGLNDLLPYFCQFVADTITKNLQSLELLMRTMRFVESLLISNYLHLEPYLHQLLPSILTCLVGKTLCLDPSAENHWALRDFSASLLGRLIQDYGSAYETLQPRVAKTLIDAWLGIVQRPLTTHYGAIRGLVALGHGAQIMLLFPNISLYVPLVEAAANDSLPIRKLEAGRVHALLLEVELFSFVFKFTSLLISQYHRSVWRMFEACWSNRMGSSPRSLVRQERQSEIAKIFPSIQQSLRPLRWCKCFALLLALLRGTRFASPKRLTAVSLINESNRVFFFDFSFSLVLI